MARQTSTTREDWRTIVMSMPPEGRAVVEKAMRLAGILLGPGASDGQKVAFIAATYLSAHRRPGEGQ